MSQQPKKIFFAALGCPKNQVDGELMLGRARAAGHIVVDDAAEADVLVVNTCAFINEAREESIEVILGLAGLKNPATGKRLLVSGCMAERYSEELAREIPEIDALIGTGALDRFEEAVGGGDGVYKGPSHYLPSATMPRLRVPGDASAYLKVSDGCDHECAFCAIPSFRGKHESRTIDDVVAEARKLAGQGVVEVNLVAQDLSAYGRDQGIEEGLATLLEALGAVVGLQRVRCLYLYPSTLTQAALEAIRDVDNVVPYVDIPLQHADGQILRAMRRHRDTGAVERIVERVRGIVPDAALRSSFIVGFPGESEQAFARLCRFVEDSRFDRIAVFTYSDEDGTAACGLQPAVEHSLALRRRDELLALQEPISARRLAAEVGKSQRILVCGQDEVSGWFGRSDKQAPEIDGVTYLQGDLEAFRGRCLDAQIIGSDAYDLFAVGAVSPGSCISKAATYSSEQDRSKT